MTKKSEKSAKFFGSRQTAVIKMWCIKNYFPAAVALPAVDNGLWGLFFFVEFIVKTKQKSLKKVCGSDSLIFKISTKFYKPF